MYALLSGQVNTSLCSTIPFILNSYLLCMAMCCLVQGQSTHLRFILDRRFPLVSGADLSANADEHVADANSRARPLLSLFHTWGVVLTPTVVFSCRMKICWYDINKFSASHLSSISSLSVTGWMQQFRSHTDLDKKSSSNTSAYQCPYVLALKYELIYSEGIASK